MRAAADQFPGVKGERQFPRSPCRAPIELNGVVGTAADLSAGGLSADVRASFRPGTTVFGRINLAGVRFDYTGRVVWASAASAPGALRVGIRFLGVEHAYFEALTRAAPASASP